MPDKPTIHEYQVLTKSWDGAYGAGWNAACEFCIEAGWMDHFGIVTPKGHKAIEAYEGSLE